MMRTKVFIGVLVVIMASALIVLRLGASQAALRTTWEYRIVQLPESKSFSGADYRQANERALNDLGAEGWELVSYQPVAGDLNPFGHGVYYLKRPR